jgi:hypothetical protein
MPNPTAGNCFHPIDDPAMRSDAMPCFDPDHETASTVTPVDMCFHPADHPQAVAPVAMCFHPADHPQAVSPVAICFHPADEPTAAVPVDMCFHPADRDVDLRARPDQPVSPCYRPGDDLATDLHRALTGADERDLAALAGRP